MYPIDRKRCIPTVTNAYSQVPNIDDFSALKKTLLYSWNFCLVIHSDLKALTKAQITIFLN